MWALLQAIISSYFIILVRQLGDLLAGTVCHSSRNRYAVLNQVLLLDRFYPLES